MSRVKVLFAPFYDAVPYQQRLSDELAPHGVEVHGAPSVGLEQPTFIEQVRELRPELLHLHWLHPWFLEAGLFATLRRTRGFLAQIREARALGARVIWTAHNLINHERLHVRVDSYVTRKVARGADAIIAHGQAARQRLVEFCGNQISERIEIIPLGHHIGESANTIDRNSARSELGLEANQIVLLFLGRIRNYKGVAELLEAFLEAAPGASCKLLIAGKTHGDEARLQLKRRCKQTPNVELHYGFVPDDRIQVFMNAADFVVLPYRDILSSDATLLATSFAKAVIAPRLACLTEYIHGEGGVLYDPGDPSGLTGAIRNAVERVGEAEAMGRRNLEVAQLTPWSRSAELTNALYRRVVSGG